MAQEELTRRSQPLLDLADLDNILILCYCLVEQGKFQAALSILLLAADDYKDNFEFNKMLFSIFYLQKEYRKCSLLIKKQPQLTELPLIKFAQTVCESFQDNPTGNQSVDH